MKRDWLRTGLGPAFMVYSAGTIWFLSRSTPRVGPAKFWSPISITFHSAFMVAMGMRSYAVDGRALPEITAITCAVLLCFSFGRYNTFQVVLSTVLSCASYSRADSAGDIRRP